MAAPRKTEAERRTRQLPPIRCNESEYKIIASKASEAGMSISQFMRERALSHNTAKIKQVKKTEFDPTVIHQLIRIGSNLNQLVTSLHATGNMRSSWEAVHRELSDFLHGKIFRDDCKS